MIFGYANGRSPDGVAPMFSWTADCVGRGTRPVAGSWSRFRIPLADSGSDVAEPDHLDSLPPAAHRSAIREGACHAHGGVPGLGGGTGPPDLRRVPLIAAIAPGLVVGAYVGPNYQIRHRGLRICWACYTSQRATCILDAGYPENNSDSLVRACQTVCA